MEPTSKKSYILHDESAVEGAGQLVHFDDEPKWTKLCETIERIFQAFEDNQYSLTYQTLTGVRNQITDQKSLDMMVQGKREDDIRELYINRIGNISIIRFQSVEPLERSTTPPKAPPDRNLRRILSSYLQDFDQTIDWATKTLKYDINNARANAIFTECYKREVRPFNSSAQNQSISGDFIATRQLSAILKMVPPVDDNDIKEILDFILRVEDPHQFKEEHEKLLKGSRFILGQNPFDLVVMFKELLILSILGRTNDLIEYSKSSYLVSLQMKILHQMLPAVTDFSKNNPGHRIALTLRALVLNAIMNAEQEFLISDYIADRVRRGITEMNQLKALCVELMTRRLPEQLNKKIPSGILLDVVEELVQKDPQNPLTLRIKVEVLIRLNKSEEAVRSAEELVSRYPDDEHGLVLLSGCKLMNNDAYSALEVCEAAFKINPKSPGAWFGKILSLLFITDSPEVALEAALEAHDLFPDQDMFKVLVTLLTFMKE